jgi:DNA-binding XRE family transcriptional regulator
MSEIQNNENRQYSLKELRARKNETQAQTAAALGVTVQTYNAWENKVASHFGVAITEIKV